ncbi:hypothetical protein F2P81_019490 [Scophthalmus maximus]|uniref:Uncharacterized protein n=1 Tax=Scophthalmus maximus TaxID=52904 RepID=A0A6A4S235_SCOMX|nr:hypothetical protein F2P81_019490 [Scophthalmus maximus]
MFYDSYWATAFMTAALGPVCRLKPWPENIPGVTGPDVWQTSRKIRIWTCRWLRIQLTVRRERRCDPVVTGSEFSEGGNPPETSYNNKKKRGFPPCYKR